MKTDLRDEIAKTAKEFEGLLKTDEKAHAFVDKLNQILAAVAEGKKSPKEIAEDIGALESSLGKMSEDAMDPQAFDDMAEALGKVGKELEKAGAKIKEKELEEVGKLLDEEKFDEAAKAVEKLLERFQKMSPKEQERLAKLFGDLAKKFASKFQKQMDKLTKQRDRLAQKEKQKGGLSQRDKSRLNKLDKQLEKLGRKQNEMSKGAQKNLDRLSRNMKDMANQMRRSAKEQRKSQGDKGQKPQPKMSRLDKKQMQKLSDMMRRMGQEKKMQRLRRTARMRLGDIKEMLRRRGELDKGRKRLEKLARGKKGKGDKGQKDGQELGKGRKGPPGGKMVQTDQPGGDYSHTNRKSDPVGQGHGKARMLAGKATDLAAAKLRSEKLKGQLGKGPSRREMLIGVAKKGTRVAGYGEVHIDYSRRASEAMAREKVPPGYREYVERYFRLIRQR